MKAKTIYEQLGFDRNLGPKESMGIGKRATIIKWFDDLDIRPHKYVIHDDLSIDFKGDLYCSSNQLTSLPDNLTINGYLDCEDNQLTSLPNNLTVNGSLFCNHNKLTSLPDNLIVNGNLWCDNNPIANKSDEEILKGGAFIKGRISKE